jgi:hypothetical protein
VQLFSVQSHAPPPFAHEVALAFSLCFEAECADLSECTQCLGSAASLASRILGR